MRQPAGVGDWRPRRLCASYACVRCSLPLFFIVLAFSVALIYPWARDGASIAPDVARLMLNAPLFAVYGLVALVGWAAIAASSGGRTARIAGRLAVARLSRRRGQRRFRRVAAFRRPSLHRFRRSAPRSPCSRSCFALAAIAVLAPARAIALAKGDIAALLLASALGAFYLGLMTFIVKWYGDQPDDAAWYLARAHGLAFALLLGALVFGSRRAHRRLRMGARPDERASDAGSSASARCLAFSFTTSGS